MINAEQIRDGLDFLIKEAKKMRAAMVVTGAEHDIFYAHLHCEPPTIFYVESWERHTKMIQKRMLELHWFQMKDAEPFDFAHYA